MSAARAKRNTRGTCRIFSIPLALAAISLAGPVAALLTDGPIDPLWTPAIAVPLTTILNTLLTTVNERRRTTHA